MTEREQRPTPVPLGAGGMWVPAEIAGELAGALALYRDLLMGRRPPISVSLPRPTRVLDDLQAVAATVAREHQAARHRTAAFAAASAHGISMSAPLVPCAETVAPLPTATVTVVQAADRLKLSDRRVRQLAAAGRISGVRSSRQVWLLDAESVAAYTARRRRHTDGHDRTTAGAPEPDRAAQPGADGGLAAA